MKGKPESEDQNMFNSSLLQQARNNFLIYQLIYYMYIEQYKCQTYSPLPNECACLMQPVYKAMLERGKPYVNRSKVNLVKLQQRLKILEKGY